MKCDVGCCRRRDEAACAPLDREVTLDWGQPACTYERYVSAGMPRAPGQDGYAAWKPRRVGPHFQLFAGSPGVTYLPASWLSCRPHAR